MMDLMRNDHLASFVVSVLATLFTFAFGPDQIMLQALLILMAADYVTGILASVIDGKGLSSAYGFYGLLKKFAILIIIAVTHHVDLLLGTSVAMLGALYFYSGIELISITENCGRMGIPLPSSIRNAIVILKQREGDDDGGQMAPPVSDREISSDRSE